MRPAPFLLLPVAAVMFAALPLLGGCDQNAARTSPDTATENTASKAIAFDLPATANAKDSLEVSLATFKNNGTIPLAQTAYGQNISPALSWAGAPKNTKTFALLAEDPDASSPKPFIHWLVANIPANENHLPQNLPPAEVLKSVGGAVQGAGSSGQVGYFGPKPPAGSGVHHYHFQVFALDEQLKLPPRFDRQTLLNAMQDHVLAKGQIIGTYEQK